MRKTHRLIRIICSGGLIAGISLCTASLSGCGKKGPLYLEPASTATSKTEPATEKSKPVQSETTPDK